MLRKKSCLAAVGLILTLAVIFTIPVAAYGSEPDSSDPMFLQEQDAKFLVGDDPAVVSVDIYNFKGKLRDYGFYSVGVSDDTLRSKELDDLTMAAVKLVCDYNPDLTYYPNGVSYQLYWRVMGDDGGTLRTPQDQVYELIVPGTAGDAVTRIQNQLNQLGYDAAGFTFTPGVYDDELQKAIDAFVNCNKFVYERSEGIPVALQELLFSGNAVRYTEEGAKPASFSEKIFSWLKAKGSVFGIRLPNAALVAIGFVLVGGIVVLVVFLVMPSGGKHVQFTVQYAGKTSSFTADLKKPLHIGRSAGDGFPLNASDESVSRNHCVISLENGEVIVQDDSSFGTVVNGETVHHAQKVLHSGDMMEIGKHHITIRFK